MNSILVGVLPEGELSSFVSDLCALENWNDARVHVLGDRDSSYSYCDGDKKQACLGAKSTVVSNTSIVANLSVTLSVLRLMSRYTGSS